MSEPENPSQSYVAIARRWRPSSFKSLVGQEPISQTLTNALRNNRLHHALLFTGIRGTGKTSTARILAKSLRCPNAKDFEPCNVCSECTDIHMGRSLNVVEIDGASNNGVDAIRELRETVGFMPSSGHHKVYIIDEVHMLSTSAFNALLKTLEEPPPHVIFIMATTEAQKIPATILSRCQRFDFRRIPTRYIFETLQGICTSDKIPFDDGALWAIARQADGSMRDSQSLLDQMITFSPQHLSEKSVLEALGLTDRSLIHEALTALVHRDVQTCLTVVEKINAMGLEAKVFLEDLMLQVRNLMFLKLRPKDPKVELSDSEIQSLLSLAEGLSNEDIHFLFDMSLKGSQDVLRAQDPTLVLEMVLLRMAQAPLVSQIRKFLPQTQDVGKPTEARAPIPPKPSTVSEPLRPRLADQKAAEIAKAKDSNEPKARDSKPESSVPTGPPPPFRLEDSWNLWVQSLRKESPLLGSKLENLAPVSFDEKNLLLKIPSKLKFLFDAPSILDAQKAVGSFLQKTTGQSVTVKIEHETGSQPTPKSPREMAADKEKQRQTDVRTAVENHPLVTQARSVFKMEIESIKELT